MKQQEMKIFLDNGSQAETVVHLNNKFAKAKANVITAIGEIERYNIFRARMLVRCDANGKLFLYDIVQIKKETSNSLGE